MFHARLPTFLAMTMLLATAVIAQDKPKATPTTTQDPTIAKPALELQLVPLTKDELIVEADGWLGVLQTQAKAIATAKVQALSGTTLDMSAMTKKQAEIAARFDLVLAALKKKGGKVDDYRTYVNTVTAVQDPSAIVTTIGEWVQAPDGGIKWAINLGLFLITLLLFNLLARITGGIMKRTLSRARGTSELLRDFFVNAVKKLVFFVGLVVAVSFLGADIGPFLAAMGAAGFIIGFALQGTLSNFAAGIMILFYRPYDLGEVVTVAGTTGKVSAMSLVATTLKTPDNQTLVIPNNSIWGGIITNVTGSKTRRVDLKFGISYDDDIDKTLALLKEIVEAHPKVLDDPKPVIKCHELADSSVNFVCRPWAKTGDYWDVYWDLTKQVKQRFDAEDVSIPFPQRDVHMHEVKA